MMQWAEPTALVQKFTISYSIYARCMPWALNIMAVYTVSYLVVPWFLGQHFNTLEPRCFTLCSKRGSFRKEFHVYTLSQINESQAMREIIYVTRIVVQKPSTKTSSSNQRLQCHDMVASHIVKGNTCLSPSMKLSGLMSPWMILQLWSSSTIWRIFTAK